MSIHQDKKVSERNTLTKYNRPIINKALKVKKFFGKYVEIPTPTHHLNINDLNIVIKDESCRMEQKSFKGLGCTYSLSKEIIRKYNLNPELTFEELINISSRLPNKFTVSTASDGNHGAGLAWASDKLGFKSIIWLPNNVKQSRIDKVLQFGATVRVTDVNYDATVDIAKKVSIEKNYLLIQDTSWEGYEKIPRLIMDGYTLIMHELSQLDINITHIVLQVGVGSFAASLTEFIREQYDDSIILICIEPNGAACMYDSIKYGIKKDFDCSGCISAGLDCGKLSTIAWKILRNKIDYVVKVNDTVVEDGIKILNQNKILSGESGSCVGVGFLKNLNKKQKEVLKFNELSSVLIFNTEGITDEKNYNSILNKNNLLSNRSIEIYKSPFSVK